jgi:D-3-phosphoglycerate dehydrogenase
MPSGLRVLLTDRAWPDAEIERAILSASGIELIEAQATDEASLCRLAAGVHGIITNWAKVTDAVIRSARGLRVVCRAGIGLDNIAVATASELKIPVTNVPDYCVGEVADHALALLLACNRQVAFFDHRAKQGEYRLQAAPPLRRLAGKVLGLVGLGRIARNLAPALGMHVIAHTAGRGDHGTGIPMRTLDELLPESDFVSLHVPLTKETRHLLRQPQFESMRRSAYLINTSRGGLIDHADLWTALERGLIAGAALDVFDPEPPDLSQPLFHDERVIVTPHAAFVSVESLENLRQRVATQAADALLGRRPECVVNPQVLSEQRAS